MREDAPQREHDLRHVLNALRWLIKTGSQWRMMPHDFPPWPAVYQQARRWIEAGCFEAMTHDLREIVRISAGRNSSPMAVIFDARTIQSTSESGGRGGYDGGKRKKGSKVHAAVDTLGNLLTVNVTAANAKERAEVADLSAAVQNATGLTVTLAYGSGLHRGAACRRCRSARDPFGSGQTHRSEAGFRAVAATVGGRTIVRLAGPIPEVGPRL